MSAQTSATPPSAAPSVPPQGQPFPLPSSAAASVLTSNKKSNLTGMPTTTSRSPTTTQQPPLPPPQTFDILPPLHALLSRLEPTLNHYTNDPIVTANAIHNNATTTTTTPSVSFDSSVSRTGTVPGPSSLSQQTSSSTNAAISSTTNTSPQTAPPSSTSAIPNSATLASTTQSQSQPTTASSATTTPPANQRDELPYKEIQIASQPIKSKIRRALQELSKLGDMDRSIADQNVEIQELERKIKSQREVLGRLAGLAADASSFASNTGAGAGAGGGSGDDKGVAVAVEAGAMEEVET